MQICVQAKKTRSGGGICFSTDRACERISCSACLFFWLVGQLVVTNGSGPQS